MHWSLIEFEILSLPCYRLFRDPREASSQLVALRPVADLLGCSMAAQ